LSRAAAEPADFPSTRKEKLEASKKKREAKKETVTDDEDKPAARAASPNLLAGDPDDDEVQAPPKASRVVEPKRLKVTTNRSVDTDGSSSSGKPKLTQEQARLKATLKARAPAPQKPKKQESTGLFSFVSKDTSSPKKKPKKPDATALPLKKPIKKPEPAAAAAPMEKDDVKPKKPKKPTKKPEDDPVVTTPKRPIVVDADDAVRAPKRARADPSVRRRLDDEDYDGAAPAPSLPFMAPGVGLCFTVYPATAAQMGAVARVFK
jgi:hypothetical protein